LKEKLTNYLTGRLRKDKDSLSIQKKIKSNFDK